MRARSVVMLEITDALGAVGTFTGVSVFAGVFLILRRQQ
jgi:hypothetical protein